MRLIKNDRCGICLSLGHSREQCRQDPADYRPHCTNKDCTAHHPGPVCEEFQGDEQWCQRCRWAERLHGGPPRDRPPFDMAVIRSVGAMCTWEGAPWWWDGRVWQPSGSGGRIRRSPPSCGAGGGGTDGGTGGDTSGGDAA